MTDFDVDAAVSEYRQLIGWRDAETDLIARLEFQAVANRLRSQWWEWSGDDDLHETAFSEPFDDETENAT